MTTGEEIALEIGIVTGTGIVIDTETGIAIEIGIVIETGIVIDTTIGTTAGIAGEGPLVLAVVADLTATVRSATEVAAGKPLRRGRLAAGRHPQQ